MQNLTSLLRNGSNFYIWDNERVSTVLVFATLAGLASGTLVSLIIYNLIKQAIEPKVYIFLLNRAVCDWIYAIINIIYSIILLLEPNDWYTLHNLERFFLIYCTRILLFTSAFLALIGLTALRLVVINWPFVNRIAITWQRCLAAVVCSNIFVAHVVLLGKLRVLKADPLDSQN